MSRQRDKWVTRVIAWMLSFAMAVSLVVIPSDKTEAAGETIALSYSTDQVTASGNVDNQVSLDLGNGGYSDLLPSFVSASRYHQSMEREILADRHL